MSLDLHTLMLTNNDCYKKNQKIVGAPKGIIVHSTGCNNTALRRYLAPDDGIIGPNAYNNHWNRPGIDKCVHGFIGKDKNGIVQCYQTLPFDVCCWGIGRGKIGSYNYDATSKYPKDEAYIQFEMCEDDLTNLAYFNKVMEKAQEFCAYIMNLFPNITIDNVISHYEGYKRGMGSGHSDCDNWLNKFGKNMEWFRQETLKKLAEIRKATPEEPKKEDAEPAPAPAKTIIDTYTVQKGDTFSKIAAKFNMTVTQLSALNPSIKNINLIVPGQKINVYKTAASAPKKSSVECAKFYDKSFDRYFKVTSISMNIRVGAGFDKSVVVVIPKGTNVRCNGYYNLCGTKKWYLVSFTYNGQTYEGYGISTYLK